MNEYSTREEVARLLEERREKWERLHAQRDALAKAHGELVGLLLYRQILEREVTK